MHLREQGATAKTFLLHGRAIKGKKRRNKRNESSEQKRGEKQKVIDVGITDNNDDTGGNQHGNNPMKFDEIPDNGGGEKEIREDSGEERLDMPRYGESEKVPTDERVGKISNNLYSERNETTPENGTKNDGKQNADDSLGGQKGKRQGSAQKGETVGTVRLRFSILFDGGVGPPLGGDDGNNRAPPPNPTINAENIHSGDEHLIRTSVLDAVVWALCEDNNEANFVVTGGPCGEGWQAEDGISVSIVAPYAGAGMTLLLKNGWVDVTAGSSDYKKWYGKKGSTEFQNGISFRWTAWDITVPVIHVAERLAESSPGGKNTGPSVMKAKATGATLKRAKTIITESSSSGADAQSAALWNVERSANAVVRSQTEAGSFDSILRASDGRIWASSPLHLEQEFFGRWLISPAAEQAGLTGGKTVASSKKRMFGMHPTLLAAAVLMLVLGLLVAYLMVRPRRRPKSSPVTN